MMLKTLPQNSTVLNNLTCYEPINYDTLKLLMNSKLLKETFRNPFVSYKNELSQLSKYAKNYDHKKQLVKVVYKRSDIQEYGRVFPEKSLGLHCIRRELRQTLCKDYLVDIDIVNAHPVILYQLTTKFNIPNTKLKYYIENRDNVIELIKKTYDIDRDTAKTLIIRLLYLGSYNRWLKEYGFSEKIQFIEDFKKEIVNISQFIVSNNEDLCKLLKSVKNKNKNTSVMSYYLQTIENYILEEIFKYCRENKIIKDVFVLSNDGIMIPKESYYEDICSDFNRVIKKKYDLDLTFIHKEFKQYYTDDEINNNQYDTELIDNFFDELSLSSQYYLADMFYELFNDNKYIYNLDYGWFEYNDNNIIMNTGKEPPFSLSKNITLVLQEKLKDMYKLMVDMIPPHHPNFKTYNNLYKVNYKSLGSTKYKEGIIKELRIKYEDRDLMLKIDSNNNLLPFSDQLFDFSINQYRNIERSDYISKFINYKAPINKNLKIRDELKNIVLSIFGCDDMVQYFLDTIAFPLFTNEFEKLYIWTGTGGNGKGLLLNLISKSYDKFFYIPDNKFLTTHYRAGAANPSLYNTKGCKLVMVSEPEGDDQNDIQFNLEFVKKITGNDEITCRDMYKSNITFSPKFALFMQCNEKPKLDKLDNAVKRRFEMSQFPYQYVENPKHENEKKIDKSLKGKLSDPLYYIEFMGLLIDQVRHRFNNRVINIPASVKEDTTQYLNENNFVLDFINNELERTENPKDRILVKELYNRYIAMEYQKMTYSKFKYNMTYNKIHKKKYNNGDNYIGIKYKDKEEEDENMNDLDI